MEQWRLLLLTAAMGGVYLGFGLQVGGGTAVMQSMGVSSAMVSMVWLFGPISGIVMGPLIGHYSDNCTHPLGRRRPVMLAFALISVVSFLIFGNAGAIGEAFGSKALGIGLAIFGFGAMDFSLNGIQAPLRALLLDVVPPKQQKQGQSMFGIFAGIGQTIGYLLGTCSLGSSLWWFRLWGDTALDHDVQALYGCGAVLLVSAVLASCVAVTEEPLPPSHARQATNVLQQTVEAANTCPLPIARAWVVQFFHFFCFFTIFTFGTDYFGQFVYGGDPAAPRHSDAQAKYAEGVKAGNLALALQTSVSVLFNCAVPRLIDMVGIKKLLLGSDMLLAACLCGLALQPHPSWHSTTTLFGLLGIPWATTTSVLWYIVGRACKGMPNAGLYNGLFNMSQCFPEIAISLVGLVLFGLGGNDKTLFLVGAVGAVSACCLVPWIVEPDEEANQEVAEAPEHEAADCGAPLIPKKENSSDHLDTSWSL